MDQKELREQENRCIQEQAPACTASCPMHVDVRGMIAELVKGDFAAGYRIFHKAVPFPGIVSRICRQPCQAACLRKDLGGAIEIAALEHASCEFGAQGTDTPKPLPPKAKTVAIVGAGLSGLTAAHDLARKGWQVVIYEAAGRVGGSLWQISSDLLPGGVLAAELGVVAAMGVTIRLNAPVGMDGAHSDITSLSEEYDAIFLAVGDNRIDITGFDPDENNRIRVDPLTFQTSREKIFAGGGILHSPIDTDPPGFGRSAILAMSEGRRAAVSIDRFLQKVSLTAARTNEGAYETRLYTNMAGLEIKPPSVPTNLSTCYTKETAQTEAERCIQCECLECVRACEYLSHYQGYPKKYIREIYNNLSIVMGTRYANQFINSCALCGLCREVCPTDVDMGEICLTARRQMVTQKRMPPSAHDFALRDMASSNGAAFALARHAPGKETSSMIFFPGCQLSATSPKQVEQAYDFLQAALPNESVGLMLRCCGAPAEWAGREDLLAAAQTEFRAEYERLGRPKVILVCSSCYQMFQKYLNDVEFVSFWNIYDQYGPQQFPAHQFQDKITIHDPCSTRYEHQIHDAVRHILTKLGRPVQELEFSREKTECCSYGGLMWLANRPVAEEMVQRRIAESSLDYLTYCAMCRDFFARRGKRTLHLFDLIFPVNGIDPAVAPPVGFSQRQENRARLKAKLLNERWGETMPEANAYKSIRLILPDDVQKTIEERLILIEDLQKVIEYAEHNARRMYNPVTGHYLAYHKPASVTYWVEYAPQDGGAYLIFNAYSHRMEIGIGATK